VKATGNERRARGLKSVPGTEGHRSEQVLDAQPEGTALAFTLAPGVDLTFEREGGTWKVHTRRGIPSSFLAQFPSVERVRRGAGQ
jgi:hypothetical protein